ncbi:MAG: amidohydrolase [Acidobacteria bacterium]|jgi:amidohydrolase|nr:amidohydrolase [Acidobacteriota bacterium]
MNLALGLLLAVTAVPDAEIAAATKAITPEVVALRRDLHAHPELSNREERTGGLVADRLRGLGLEVRHPVAKTGVVGVLRGGRPGGVVALRADIDALPIQEAGDAPYKSQVPGVMHACGHDAHTAILLGVAEVLSGLVDRLPGTVVFLFQPAEEGAPEGEEGGAALMVKEGALDDPRVEAVFGLHVGGWVDAGQMGFSPGPIFASSDTFTITVAGRTVHGAEPHRGLDPIPVAAEIVQALQLIVTRQIDGRQPRVLTIGRIQGGTRFNIIASEVVMDGTLRTHDAHVRSEIKERMARTVKGVAEAHGTTATLRFLDEGNPPTVNDAALATMARPALERVFGPDGVIDVEPLMVAEDFPYYGEKAPYFYFELGTRNEAKGVASVNHTATFDVDEDALPLGVRALVTLAWEYLARGR